MEFIKVNPQAEPNIALIELNRPKELNALNLQLMTELKECLHSLDQDDSVKVIVITGNKTAFAAGADIGQMREKGTIDMLHLDQFNKWDAIKRIKKPLIAAVSGYALGGGFELAMICDMIIASESAKFGQPEIKIGIMPGAGGTQRLTKAIGKARAMEIILTGKYISAAQAEKWGLVNRVVPDEICLQEAFSLAKEIAPMPPIAVKLAKEAVLASFDFHLDQGLHFERKNFYMLFASNDQKEGVSAFIEKRKPDYKGN